jgi:hypothetical protein
VDLPLEPRSGPRQCGDPRRRRTHIETVAAPVWR